MGNVQSANGESWFFVTNPSVPFEQYLIGEGGGLQPGKTLYLEGKVQAQDDAIQNRFKINFYEGNNIAFHFDVRQWKEENIVVMNSHQENIWQQEQRIPIEVKLDQPFRIDFQIMQTGLVISQNHGDGVGFNFRNNVTSDKITKITIEGNIELATLFYGDPKNMNVSKDMNVSKIQFNAPPLCQNCNQPAWPVNCTPPNCTPSQPPPCMTCQQPAWQPNCPPSNCLPNQPPNQPPNQLPYQPPYQPTNQPPNQPTQNVSPPTCQNCRQPAWQPYCPPPVCSPSQPPQCQNCNQPAWQPNCPPPNCFPNQPSNQLPNQPPTNIQPPPCQYCRQPAWQPNCPSPVCSPSQPPQCQNCHQPAWTPNCPPPNCFPNQPPSVNVCPSYPPTINLPPPPPLCQRCQQPAWQPNCQPPNCSPSNPPPCQNCRQPAWQPNCPPPNCFPNQPSINVGGIGGIPTQGGGSSVPQNAAIALPNGICIGRQIIIDGIPNANASRFDIDIKGNECDGNRLLHISVRFPQCDIVMNSMRSSCWETEQRRSGVAFPFQMGQQFQIRILSDAIGYKILINGQWYADFPHRMDCSLAKSVSIAGDLHSINIQEL